MGSKKSWKNYKGLFKDNTGSFTVEATIIVSTVILTMFALILVSEFLYQKSCIQTIADRTAQRGAEIWNSPSKDMIFGQIVLDNMDDLDLYWRIWESKSSKSKKEEKIESYAGYLLKESIIFGKPLEMEITSGIVEDYIVYKKLRVSVKAKYKNPFLSLLRVFGINNTITIKAHSDAIINEPVEFIRTTDFAVDVVREVDNKMFEGKGGEIVKNVREGFSNIFLKIKDFLNNEK
ncbi:MAG TPA: pilus assembly protein [Acetivibrio sp.]|uniref:pilus assembly protein n=1 Tax=Acetivibrio sp. TaxID=1872092 RepID=UPI002C978E6F|nr:pilus assembly protein [Acetivibrio sp.]HOM03328.1 pilus assembly protein [Acetivibrio sp.]